MRQNLNAEQFEMAVKTQRRLDIQFLNDHERSAIGEAPEFVFRSFKKMPCFKKDILIDFKKSEKRIVQ